MKRRRVLAYIPAILLLLLAATKPMATTVMPSKLHCPVCGKDFATLSVSSHSFFGKRARDMSDYDNFIFNKVKCCPFCLYSALDADFEEIAPSEQAKLQKALPAMEQRLKAEFDELTQAGVKEPKHVMKDMLELFLARECYKERRTDRSRDVYLARLFHAHGANRYWTDRMQETVFLTRVLAALDKALNEDAYADGEKAVFAYLRGEFRRQANDLDGAGRDFEEAKRIISKLPPPKKRENGEEEKSFAWVSEWTEERAALIPYAAKPLPELETLLNKGDAAQEAALRVLAERKDREAWQVLTRFAMKNQDNLVLLIETAEPRTAELKIVAELWTFVAASYKQAKANADQNVERKLRRYFNNWRASEEDIAQLRNALTGPLANDVLTKYTIKAGDTLQSIARRLDTDTERLLDLNPQITDPNLIRASETLSVPNAPPGWTEWKLLTSLPHLLEQGDQNAVRYFLAWLPTVRAGSLQRLSWRLDDCFAGLVKSPTLWPLLPKKPEARDVTQQFLYDCLLFAGDGNDAGERLKERIAKAATWDDSCSLVARVFKGKNDRSLSSLIAEHLERKSGYEIHSTAELYWSELGNEEDLAILEKLIGAHPLATEEQRKASDVVRVHLDTALLAINKRLKLGKLAR